MSEEKPETFNEHIPVSENLQARKIGARAGLESGTYNVRSADAGPATDSGSVTSSQPTASRGTIIEADANAAGTSTARGVGATAYNLELEGGKVEITGSELGGKLTPDERAFAALRPFETMLGDPLGEVARKERRSLLGISALAMLVGWTDLIPTKIENFGITFTTPRRQALLWMFVAVVVYYLVAFIVYSLSDYLLHRRKVHVARVELKKREAGIGVVAVETVTLVEPEWRPARYVGRTSRSRTFFDCIVPLIVAVLGISSLVYAALHVAPEVARPQPPSAAPSAPAPPAVAPTVPPVIEPSPKTAPVPAKP